MKPGSRYLLSFTNSVSSTTTNIHTHGLHISGDGNADNVFRSLNGVPAGQCLFYSFNISNNHATGTYWYHAHYHTQTLSQVRGGALGMLLIEEKRTDGSWVDVPTSVATTNFETWSTTNEKLLFFAQVTTSNTRTVNGMTMVTPPSVNLVANQWYRFRIALSVPTGEESQFTFPNNCEAREIARDGMWLSSIPALSTLSYPVSSPSRIDIAIRCSVPTVPVYLNWGITGSITSRVQLLIASGTANSGTPFRPDGTTWQPIRPTYMPDLRNAVVQQSISVAASNNGISWNYAQPITFNMNDDIASLQFNSNYEFVFNASIRHPIHLHIYPMQIVGRLTSNNVFVAGNCGKYRAGEWYDSVIDSTNRCVARFRTADFGGKLVVHCHNLGHEDAGAMAWLTVSDPANTISNTPSSNPLPCNTF
jgi:FtsP/CotA-like multicopper oxidase with cupredoxin domain